MPVAQVADLEFVLKHTYVLDSIVDILRLDRFFLTNVNRNTEPRMISGRTAKFSVKKTRNPSFRGQREGQLVAQAGVPEWFEPEVGLATHSAATGWTIESEGATKGGMDAAYIQGKIELMADTVDEFGMKWSQLLAGTGTGAVATVKSVAGNVVTLYDEGETGGGEETYGTRLLYDKMPMSASANLTAGNYAAERPFDSWVVSIDPDNVQATMADATGLAAGNYLFWSSKPRTSKNQVTSGLRMLVDDGTLSATYEGIDRTAAGNELWKGNVIPNFGNGEIENGLRGFVTRIESRTKESVDVFISHPFVETNWFNQMRVDRQAIVPTTAGGRGPTFHGSFSALMFHHGDRSIPWISSVEAPRKRIWCLNWSAMFMGEQFQPQWLDRGEGVLKWVNEELAYKAVFFNRSNLVGTKPATCGLIDNVDEVTTGAF